MRNGGDGYYDETEENKAFQQEWEQRKAKQDEDLDVIEQGLGNLQNIAQDMGAEMNKQDVLLDEIDTQARLASSSTAPEITALRRSFCVHQR